MQKNTARPKIKLPLTSTGLLLEILAFAGLIFLWVYVIISYQKLPEIIPIHYNFKGEVDGYGNKFTIFIVPAIITLVSLFLTLLNRVPHIFNYHVNITQENAQRHYVLVTSLLRYLKLVIVALGLYISVTTVNTAVHGNSSMGYWFIPILLLLIMLPTVNYLYRSAKKS